MVRNIITDLCHHLEIGIDGNLDIGNKRVIVGTPTITLTDNILTISCDTAGASIYYTLDGSTPTSASTRYTTAVTLSNSCTIKAIAIKGSKSSIVVSQDYVAILTAWRLVGNSEVHGTEIWSCGEYNPTDGKYHILIQPQGGSIADIALTEPLRKVNDVADTIEFPSDTEGKALVTRPFGSKTLRANGFSVASSKKFLIYTLEDNKQEGKALVTNTLVAGLTTYSYNYLYIHYTEERIYGVCKNHNNLLCVTDPSFIVDEAMTQAFRDFIEGKELIYELATPTTELVDVSQIAEADSYTCIISPDGKAVSWSDFITDKEQLYAYGVQWDKEVENTDVTRIGNMELHKASKLPVQNAMRGCLLNDNGEVVQYLSDSDWQNASLLDGSQGQVMIEIPTFYWKFSEDENGIQSVMLSMVEIEGYKKVNKMYVSAYEATIDRTNNKLASVKNTSAQYRGGNNNAEWDGTYRSLLGKAATNISLTDFRTYARNRKANSYEWNCNTYQVQKILYWLFVVEYATRNSQKSYNSSLTSDGYRQGGLGAGVTNANDSKLNSEFSYYPFVPIGISDSLGNGTGEVSYSSVDSSDNTWVTVKVPRYRGIENPFGHLWKWTDGINVQVQSDNDGGKSRVYVSNDPATWNSNNYNGYTYIGDTARTNNWIKEIIFGEDGDIIPTIVGSSSQYFTDYHSTNIPNSGNVLRGLRFGGSALSGSSAGFVYSTSLNAPSYRYEFIGSRLCFVPNI